MRWKRERYLVLDRGRFHPQLLARAGNRESLFVQQLLDPQHRFHIFAAIHTLPGAALYRLELRKLGLPKPQHVSGQAAQSGNFSDAEIELVRNNDVVLCRPGLGFHLSSHANSNWADWPDRKPIGVSSTIRRATQ